MNPTWSGTQWAADTPFNIRHLVSLFFALILLWIILLIPIKKPIVFERDNDITVELIKSPVDESIQQPEQPLPDEIIESQPVVETKKPVEKVEPQPQIVKKQTTIDLTNKPSKDPKVTIQKTVITPQKPEIPDAGSILNSLEDIKSFAPIDDDFQAKQDNANDFRSKNMVPKKAPQLSPFDEQMRKDLAVKDYTPRSLRALKGVAGFLSIIPVDEKEKTSDDLPYCATLGRKSVFCPSSNPLGNQ